MPEVREQSRGRRRDAARTLSSAAGWLADAWSNLEWADLEDEAREVRGMQERCDEMAAAIETDLRRPVDA